MTFVAIDVCREENSEVHLSVIVDVLSLVFDCINNSYLMNRFGWDSCTLAITGTNGHEQHDYVRTLKFECDLLRIVALNGVRLDLQVCPSGTNDNDEGVEKGCE